VSYSEIFFHLNFQTSLSFEVIRLVFYYLIKKIKDCEYEMKLKYIGTYTYVLNVRNKTYLSIDIYIVVTYHGLVLEPEVGTMSFVITINRS